MPNRTLLHLVGVRTMFRGSPLSSHLLLVVVLFGLGCDDGSEPTGLETPPVITSNPEAVELRGHVIVRQEVGDERAMMRLSARFAPGHHVVVDSTLTVFGREIEPRWSSQGGFDHAFYDATRSINREELTGGLTVTLPRVEGVTPEPEGFAWGTVARAGPDTIRVGPGEAAILRIEVPEPGPVLAGATWQLFFDESTGSVGAVGAGTPPEAVSMPPDWFSGRPGLWGPIELVYRRSQRFPGVPPDGTYRASLGLTVGIEWALFVEAGP